MQMFMHSILNMAMIPYSQKLPFPLSSEVCCLLKYNYFTLKISGFNPNLSGGSSFWLPPGFSVALFFPTLYFTLQSINVYDLYIFIIRIHYFLRAF